VTVGAIPSTYVKPAATKAATTYTPSTSNQTIAAGTYCSGAQTIKGDANLVADNIKSGVSIFGVAGSYEGSGGSSGGGGANVETCTVQGFAYVIYMVATVMDDGAIKAVAQESGTISNVVCGSLLYIRYAANATQVNLNKLERVVDPNGNQLSIDGHLVLKVTAMPGETASVVLSTGDEW
jgi:hypothetical protein